MSYPNEVRRLAAEAVGKISRLTLLADFDPVSLFVLNRLDDAVLTKRITELAEVSFVPSKLEFFSGWSPPDDAGKAFQAKVKCLPKITVIGVGSEKFILPRTVPVREQLSDEALVRRHTIISASMEQAFILLYFLIQDYELGLEYFGGPFDDYFDKNERYVLYVSHDGLLFSIELRYRSAWEALVRAFTTDSHIATTPLQNSFALSF